MKNRLVAVLLALFLGGIGIHKFYLGYNFMGVLYVVFCWTFIPLVLSFFDFLGLVLMSDKVFNAKFNGLSSERLDVSILRVCADKFDGATISECVIATGADPQKVKEIIDQLCKKGLLTVSNRLGDHAVTYKAI
jgi:TM2 domain-containing membrane protein YozV